MRRLSRSTATFATAAVLVSLFVACGSDPISSGSGALGGGTGDSDSSTTEPESDSSTPDGTLADDAATADEPSGEVDSSAADAADASDDADDAASDAADGGDLIDAAADASDDASDASDGAPVCAVPPANTAPFVTSGSGAGWTSVPNLCTIGVQHSAGLVFGFTAGTPQQVTLVRGHGLGPTTGQRFDLEASCTAGVVDAPPPIATTTNVCDIQTTLVPAGAYELVSCFGGFGWAAVAEAPPPPAANVACPSAQALSTAGTAYDEPRVVDGTSRYYSFTVVGPGSVTHSLTIKPKTAAAGKLTFKITSGCGGALVASGVADLCSAGAFTFTTPTLPAATYIVEASSIQQGSDWSIKMF